MKINIKKLKRKENVMSDETRLRLLYTGKQAQNEYILPAAKCFL